MIPTVYPSRWHAAAWLAACVAGCAAAADSTARCRETRRLMGVPWTITLHAATRAEGEAAIAAAFAEVERLEGILSDYDPASELVRLSAAAPTPTPVPLGDDLWRALSAAVAWRDASGGAFDPTVGPLTTLWRQTRRSGTLPRTEKLAAALRAVGPRTLVLDEQRRTAALLEPGMRLDLGGIGMGYAVDRALEVLAGRGIAAAMIDASGDVAVSGPPPGRAGWRIEVAAFGRENAADGRPTIELVNAAVTTSGDAFQAAEIHGVRYSHVVDPRTGLGVAGPAAVTVIARDCTTADALATAASVLGPKGGLTLVEATSGAAARFVTAAGDGREVLSSRWPAQPAQSAP
ncbi:MAG: FAD:protein FMN transferase [Planctomycetia bacterium]|nr:FAD:protein FMN transferase [Planctomycetia bacterium]